MHRFLVECQGVTGSRSRVELAALVGNVLVWSGTIIACREIANALDNEKPSHLAV